MQHLDEGTIHAWLDGGLDAAESSRVERHVAECKTCSEAVAEARGMIAGASRIVSSLDVVPGNVIPRSSGTAAPRGWLWRSLRLTPGRAALAATLMLAVGTMLTVQHAPSDKAVPALTQMNRPVDAATRAIPPELATPKPATEAPAAGGAPSIAMRDVKTTPSAGDASAKRSDTTAAPDAGRRASGLATSGFVAPMAPSMNAAPPAKAVEKTQPGVTVSEVVPTPSAAVRVKDSANADAAKPVTATAADSMRAAAVLAARARQLSAVQGAGRGGMAFAGAAQRANEAPECYRVNSDSSSVAQTGAFLPRQFFLQQVAGSQPQNVVRAVAPDGRIDSAIAGIRWERVTPTTTTLYLTRAVGESAPTLTLRFADGRVAGQLSTPAGSRSVDIVRWSCRP